MVMRYLNMRKTRQILTIAFFLQVVKFKVFLKSTTVLHSPLCVATMHSSIKIIRN